MPEELAHVWGWFLELAATRSAGGWGPNPISYSDISAWAGLTGVAIRAPEVRTLVLLDRLWLEGYSEGAKERQAWTEQQRRRPHGR